MTDNGKPTIVEAFAAAMAEVQAVGKDGRNKQQNYNFRGVDAVVNAVGPVFRKHGIVPLPYDVQTTYRDVSGNDKRAHECLVVVTYRFYGPAGDFIEVKVPGESMDWGDKSTPKAMSVAYRIALLQSLCIPTDEPDPDSQSYERTAPPEPAPPPVETDWVWAAEFENRVKAATEPSQLADLWNELVAVFKENRLTSGDANNLKALLTNRRNEMEEAQA